MYTLTLLENDPHGFIITVVSVSVVFASLIILYFAYRLTGMLVNWNTDKPQKKKKKSNRKAAEDSLHDKESYIITIKREYTPVAHSLSSHASQYGDMAKSQNTCSSGEDIKAPLPGTMTAILVKPGDKVAEGQTVAILEAMKMENEIQAEFGGTVKEVNVSKGDSVLEGTTIVTLR